MRGLDPRIHPGIELRFRAMDCRVKPVKPGNDAHATHRNSYSTVKQREDVRPHSRGAIRPSFASMAAL
jgi:hypothetical protein